MQVVERASALIGTRFRLQGRQPDTGLDCVGVILCSFELDAKLFPSDYGFRGHLLAEVDAGLKLHFRRVSRSRARAGDALVFRLAADRLHMAIHAGDRLIQADALVGRIVERPWPTDWPLARVYRRRTRRHS